VRECAIGQKASVHRYGVRGRAAPDAACAVVGITTAAAVKSGDVIAGHSGVSPPPKLPSLQTETKMKVLRAQFFHRMELLSVKN